MGTERSVEKEASLLGRDLELSRLHDAYARALSDGPQAVVLTGAPGTGKSALLDAFLSQLRTKAAGCVLNARCHERESMPFKALEGIADGLSRYMRRLGRDAIALLPRDVFALTKMFPVLDRVEVVAAAPQRDLPHAEALRPHALAAFGELLGRIRDREPLVIAIDDAQWIDRDSVALLDAVLKQPEPPAVLLVLGVRTTQGLGSLTAARGTALQALLDGLRSNTRVRVESIALGALSPEASQRLALVVQSISDRVQALPGPARALLEVLAVSSRPLPEEVALVSAGADSNALDLLIAQQLARRAEGSATPALECGDDRIYASLDAERLRDTHRRLAQALAAQRDADLERLAMHFEGAHDPARAAQYAVGAAERAALRLAFDRAAHLYGRALELGRFDDDRTRELTLARGRALALSGRTRESAEAYLYAAPVASQPPKPSSQGLTTLPQLLSGHGERIVAQLDTLLAGQGLPALNLGKSRIPALLFWRAVLRVRGFRYELRPDERIDPAALRTLEVYWACVMGLAQIDLIRSAELASRHLWLSLSSGSATHIGRSLAYASSIAGSTGSRPSYERAASILTQAAELAERTADPYLQACVAQWSGVNALNAGRYAEAVADLERALSIYRGRCPQAAWEILLAEMFLLWSLWGHGRFGQLSEWLRAHNEQQARGAGRDLPAVMRTSFALIWLVGDDVSSARSSVAEGASGSSEGVSGGLPYSFPDFMRWSAECMIDWYTEDCDAAWRKSDVSWQRMRAAPSLRNISTRISVLYGRGGSALLALRVTRAGSVKHSQLMRAATAAQRELATSANAVGQAWAHVIEAGLACARGERSIAVEETRAALAAFETQGAAMYAAAARRRLGVLVGGEQGAALIKGADQTMQAEGIVRPDRITSMLIPACEIVRGSSAPPRIG